MVSYFDLAMIQSLADAAGLLVDELEFACVSLKNRKCDLEMKRVFVHAVLRKPSL